MVNLSQVLEGTLAKKLADMLADPAMVYPDPVVTEMERCQLVFLEDRDNFFVTLSHCHVCLFVCLFVWATWATGVTALSSALFRHDISARKILLLRYLIFSKGSNMLTWRKEPGPCFHLLMIFGDLWERKPHKLEGNNSLASARHYDILCLKLVRHHGS